jgi:acyl carrier protein
MQRSDILQELMNYIAVEMLDGDGSDLESSTPLLEWGIINSIEIIRLIHFIEGKFKVEVPFDRIIPEHLRDADSIAGLVSQLREDQSLKPKESDDSGMAKLRSRSI